MFAESVADLFFCRGFLTQQSHIFGRVSENVLTEYKNVSGTSKENKKGL